MKIIPTAFSTEGANMLQHTKSLNEDPKGLVAINPKFEKLVTALRTTVANEYKFDNEATLYHDIMDEFRLSLQFLQEE